MAVYKKSISRMHQSHKPMHSPFILFPQFGHFPSHGTRFAPLQCEHVFWSSVKWPLSSASLPMMPWQSKHLNATWLLIKPGPRKSSSTTCPHFLQVYFTIFPIIITFFNPTIVPKIPTRKTQTPSYAIAHSNATTLKRLRWPARCSCASRQQHGQWTARSANIYAPFHCLLAFPLGQQYFPLWVQYHSKRSSTNLRAEGHDY